MLLLSVAILGIIMFYLGHQTANLHSERRSQRELFDELDDMRVEKKPLRFSVYDSEGNVQKKTK